MKIVLEQELFLDNKDELLRAENDVIMANIHDEKCLNSFRSWTGIHTVNKKEYAKQYYDENKDTILEYHKQYYDGNKDVISKYKKQYRLENKEQIKEHSKIYREQNKEKIKQHNNIEMKCCCGAIYIGLCHKNRHEKTKKHLSCLHNEVQAKAETI